MTIGERIKEKRLSKNYTLEKLAIEIGVTKSTVLKYENGTIAIPSDKIEKIAEALKVSPAYLMGWEAAPKDKAKLKDIIKQIVETMKKNKIAPEELALKTNVDLETIKSLGDEKTDLSLLKITDIGSLMIALNITSNNELEEMSVKDFTDNSLNSFGEALGTVALATAIVPALTFPFLTIGLCGGIASKILNSKNDLSPSKIKKDLSEIKIKRVFQQIKRITETCKKEKRKFPFDIVKTNGDAAEFKIINGKLYIFTFNTNEEAGDIKYYEISSNKILDEKMSYIFLIESAKKFFNNSEITISEKEKLINTLQEEFFKAKFNVKKDQ